MDPTTVNTLAGQFADVLRDWLTDDEWREMCHRNATPDYAEHCASHDFCDANMAMEQALRQTLGRDPDMDRDSDLWKAAWDAAKIGWLTDTTKKLSKSDGSLDGCIRAICAELQISINDDLLALFGGDDEWTEAEVRRLLENVA